MLIISEREGSGGRLWRIYPRGRKSYFVEDLLLVFSIVGEVLGVDWEEYFTVLVVLNERSNVV